jgi:hypothetical protein
VWIKIFFCAFLSNGVCEKSMLACKTILECIIACTVISRLWQTLNVVPNHICKARTPDVH